MAVVSLAMEAIGDITASAEVSRVPVDGEEFDSRIQGGVLVGSVHQTDIDIDSDMNSLWICRVMASVASCPHCSR